MNWQKRLLELAAAGGALVSSSGCQLIVPTSCGNGLPDPCICDRMPATSPQCVAEKSCKDHGGEWDLSGVPLPAPIDAAGPGSAADDVRGVCVGYPQDAGVDAPHADGAPRD